MLRAHIEPFLKSVCSDLRIVRHSNRGQHVYHGGSDAVYLHNQFIAAIPPGNMYLNTDSRYKAKYVHRSLRGLFGRLKNKGVLHTHKLQEAKWKLSQLGTLF